MPNWAHIARNKNFATRFTRYSVGRFTRNARHTRIERRNIKTFTKLETRATKSIGDKNISACACVVCVNAHEHIRALEAETFWAHARWQTARLQHGPKTTIQKKTTLGTQGLTKI